MKKIILIIFILLIIALFFFFVLPENYLRKKISGTFIEIKLFLFKPSGGDPPCVPGNPGC